jgi:tetratricopeptide (TPR) repeat protein
MAPDPKARYASAAELADDVDRFLADEPVQAFPDPPSVRAWRFVKRHRALAAAAAALLLTSAVALGIGIVAVSRQRDIAKENAAATRRVIEKFIRVVADQEWAAIPGTADLRLKAVTNVLDEYPRLIEQQADDPDLRFDAAVLDLHCANLYRTLGDLTRANELYLQSRDAMGKLMSAHPRNTTYHLAWGHLLCDAGDVALRAHGPSEAIGTFEETLRQAESLAERQPDDPNVRILLARVRTDIADALLEAGSITEACKFAELGANDFITLVGHEGDDYQIRLMAVIARVVSAKAARVSGRIPDARKWADGAVTEADRLGIDFPGPSDVDWVRAISLLERARLESKAAIASSPSPKSTMEEALEAARALVKSSPNVPVYRRLLSEMLVDQVDCLLSVAKPVDAVDAAREAVVLLGGPKSLADSTEGEGMPRMNIETHRLIARAYAALGRALRVAEDDAGASWAFAAARPHFDAAIEAAPRNGSLRTEADAANSQ